MTHRHSHRRGGCRHGLGRDRFPNREEWLNKLEEHQKDLEQEVADVADLIRHLKEEQTAETSAGTPTGTPA